MTTPRFGLTFLTASQAQKHVTVNDAIRSVDGLIMAVIEDKDTVAQPGSPVEGTLYIVGPSATGTNWAGRDDDLAWYADGAWYFFTPEEGMRVWVKDEGREYYWTSLAWEPRKPYFRANKTSDQNFTTGWVDLTGWATEQFGDSSVFSFNNTTGVLTINRAGKFIFNCRVELEHGTVGSNPQTSKIRAMQNTGEVTGSRVGAYNDSDTTDNFYFGFSYLNGWGDGDTFHIEIITTNATGTPRVTNATMEVMFYDG